MFQAMSLALGMEINPGPQGAHSLVGEKDTYIHTYTGKYAKGEHYGGARAKEPIVSLMSTGKKDLANERFFVTNRQGNGSQPVTGE